MRECKDIVIGLVNRGRQWKDGPSMEGCKDIVIGLAIRRCQ